MKKDGIRQNFHTGIKIPRVSIFFNSKALAYCVSPADGMARISFFTTRSRKHKLSCLVPSNHLMPKKNKTFVMSWDRSRIHMSPLYCFSPENEAPVHGKAYHKLIYNFLSAVVQLVFQPLIPAQTGFSIDLGSQLGLAAAYPTHRRSKRNEG